jgi:PEP-CTERM motif
MKKNDLRRLILALMFVWSAAEPVIADQIVYQNYFVGGVGAYGIGHTYTPDLPVPVVSDSFEIKSSTSLTDVYAYFWVNAGDSPTSIDWKIGTTPFSKDISSGTSSITSVYFEQDAYGVNSVFQSNFSINGIVNPGTYYLTLGNGYTRVDASYGHIPHLGDLLWDVSFGPSTVQVENPVINFPVNGSNSFELYGNPAPVPISEPSITNQVPEPSTIILAGLGCLGIAIHALRRTGRLTRASNSL